MAKQLKITSFFNSPASAGPKPARPIRGTSDDELEVSIIDDNRGDDTGNDADVDDDDIIIIEPSCKSIEKVVRPMPVMTLLSDSSDNDDDDDDSGAKNDKACDQNKNAAGEVKLDSDDDTNIRPVFKNHEQETKKRPLAEISSTNEADEDSGEDSDEVQKPRQRAKTAATFKDQASKQSGNKVTRKEETPCKIEEDGIIGMKVRSPPNGRVAPILLD